MANTALSFKYPLDSTSAGKFKVRVYGVTCQSQIGIGNSHHSSLRISLVDDVCEQLIHLLTNKIVQYAWNERRTSVARKLQVVVASQRMIIQLRRRREFDQAEKE